MMVLISVSFCFLFAWFYFKIRNNVFELSKSNRVKKEKNVKIFRL